MASQISHIVYADKYLNKKNSSKINRNNFILGTVFPDIRRMAKGMSRRDTHSSFNVINLNFNDLTSFKAGWKFHLYCDIKREEILRKYNFYSLEGTTDFACAPSKLLEDKIIYEQYGNDWGELVYFFRNPSEIKLEIKISYDMYKLWYAVLADYINRKPDENSMQAFLLNLPSIADKADDIIKVTGDLEKNQKAVNILKEVAQKII